MPAARAELVHRVLREPPGLFVVDDVHWLDPATVELLAVLIEPLADDGWLVVVVRRPDAPPRHRGSCRWRCDRSPTTSRTARGMVIRSVALSDARIEAIVRRAGGNPLFAAQLARSPLGPGDVGLPESAERVVGARLDLLPAALRTRLRRGQCARPRCRARRPPRRHGRSRGHLDDHVGSARESSCGGHRHTSSSATTSSGSPPTRVSASPRRPRLHRRAFEVLARARRDTGRGARRARRPRRTTARCRALGDAEPPTRPPRERPSPTRSGCRTLRRGPRPGGRCRCRSCAPQLFVALRAEQRDARRGRRRPSGPTATGSRRRRRRSRSTIRTRLAWLSFRNDELPRARQQVAAGYAAPPTGGPVGRRGGDDGCAPSWSCSDRPSGVQPATGVAATPMPAGSPSRPDGSGATSCGVRR